MFLAATAPIWIASSSAAVGSFLGGVTASAVCFSIDVTPSLNACVVTLLPLRYASARSLLAPAATSLPASVARATPLPCRRISFCICGPDSASCLLTEVAVSELFFNCLANSSPFFFIPGICASMIAPCLLITEPNTIRSRRFLRSRSVMFAMAASSSARCLGLILAFSISNANDVFSALAFSTWRLASSPLSWFNNARFLA